MTESTNTRRQKPYKVLLVGDSCIDEYFYGRCDRLNPEAPVPVLVIDHAEQKPGMAGNVLMNLQKLGLEVSFFTNKEEIIKRRYIDSRSGQHLLRVDQDVHCDPVGLVLDPSLVDCVVISDYNKGFVTAEFIERIQRSFDGPIFLDTKKRDLKKFGKCIVKINQLEHESRTSDAANAIVTYGKHGCEYRGVVYPAPQVEVVDVCGAGDTFLAALAHQYLETNSMEQAIQFAIKAAAITVQHQGVYAPSLEEIENENISNRS